MELDFIIPPGNNYSLTVIGPADLWRNSAGVAYPYDIGTVARITGSTDGGSYYPYFFDWEVEVGGGSCTSTMTPVTVDVQICTGVDAPLSLRGFEVYPNPARDRFNVSMHLLHAATVDLELTDLLGRMAYQERFKAASGQVVHRLEASHLPSGIYTLSLRTEGRLFQRRVVLEH